MGNGVNCGNDTEKGKRISSRARTRGRCDRPWNTLFRNAALEQLQNEDFPLKADDVARLWPLVFNHINLLGRYARSPFRMQCNGESRASA